MSATIVLFWVALGATALPITALAAKIHVEHGATTTVCKAAAQIAARIAETDFWSGQWRNAFGVVDWIEESYPTVTAEGRAQRVPYSRLAIDIDNDGKRDIVVRYTDMQGSVLWDWIYILEPSDYQIARKRDDVGKLLQTAPQLNPDNSVQFTNGSSGVPVESQIWKHGKMNYMVLKEHFFLKREPKLPSSLFVGRLQSRPSDMKSRRMPIELVCRFR
jgi:hypothetical protein